MTRRVFLVTTGAQLLVMLVTGILRTSTEGSRAPTIAWVVIFGAMTALLSTALNRFSAPTRLVRVALLPMPMIWAMSFYFVLNMVTAGYLANLKYPLLLIFVGGSVTCYVALYWNDTRKFAFLPATVSFVAVLGIGLLPGAVVLLQGRHHQTRLIVVKYKPGPDGSDSHLSVGLDHAVAGITPHENDLLQQLQLKGSATVTVATSMGPTKPPINAIVIIMRGPLKGPVSLNEPVADAVYLQENGTTFRKIPSDARVESRVVELQPTATGTVISVWRQPGERIGFQAVHWE